jgi:hypothetical protein
MVPTWSRCRVVERQLRLDHRTGVGERVPGALLRRSVLDELAGVAESAEASAGGEGIVARKRPQLGVGDLAVVPREYENLEVGRIAACPSTADPGEIGVVQEVMEEERQREEPAAAVTLEDGRRQPELSD